MALQLLNVLQSLNLPSELPHTLSYFMSLVKSSNMQTAEANHVWQKSCTDMQHCLSCQDAPAG